jgi:hypothetical protein
MGALPVVKIGNKHYFVDKRLNELRNINDPSDKESIELADAYEPISEEKRKNIKWKYG